MFGTKESECQESSRQSSDDYAITLSEDEVRRELRRVNVRKAAGPDGITGRVLRSCADQLAGLFTSIFNESLATSVVPTSFKKSVIIPVPKNSKPSCLNDYRPVALTSTVVKVFERLLKKHICSSIPVTLDPLQFAYRPNRSTDDAISQVLHSFLTHISKNVNYYRLLFIDYKIIETIKCTHSPHTSYRWRGERVIEPIKCMCSPHTSYRWRGERVIEPIKCTLSPHTSYRWRGERET